MCIVTNTISQTHSTILPDPNHSPIQTLLYCDNISVFHCRRCLKRSILSPNDTLVSDWDVLHQIIDSFSNIPTHPIMIHVKSRQDQDTPFENLSLKVQLNCKADWLAGDYLKDYHKDDRTKVPRLPVNLSQLHIAAGTVTYKTVWTLRNLRTEPPTIAKMMWDNPTWSKETIDTAWTAHGRAINRHEQGKNTLVKYLHNILPVGVQVHKYGHKYTNQCPSCQQDNETQQHLLLCQAASRQAWRCLFMSIIRNHMDKAETNLELMTIALDGIRSVFTGNIMHHSRYPQKPQ